MTCNSTCKPVKTVRHEWKYIASAKIAVTAVFLDEEVGCALGKPVGY